MYDGCVSIGKEVNISSNFEISMIDVLDMIKELLKAKVDFITDEQRIRPKNSEVFRLWGDNSLLINLTDWKPLYNLEKGLKKTIEWFSKPENLIKYKSGIYNI